MNQNRALTDAIHGVMNEYMLSLDSYDEKKKIFWLISDDLPLFTVTDLAEGLASVRVIIDNVEEKAAKGGLSSFDFFMNIAKSCSYFSIELEMGKYVVYSVVVHDYDMMKDAFEECLDVYNSYVNAQKACYPFL